MGEEIKLKKEEYLKLFDEIFKTTTKNNINLEKVPLISLIYNELIKEIMKTNDNYMKLRDKSIKMYDDLLENLTEKQKKKLDQYLEIETELEAKLEEQLFLYGYIFAKELDNEKSTL